MKRNLAVLIIFLAALTGCAKPSGTTPPTNLLPFASQLLADVRIAANASDGYANVVHALCYPTTDAAGKTVAPVWDKQTCNTNATVVMAINKKLREVAAEAKTTDTPTVMKQKTATMLAGLVIDTAVSNSNLKIALLTLRDAVQTIVSEVQ